MGPMPPRLCTERPRHAHPTRLPSGKLAILRRMVRCGNVEDRQIRMLELQPFLACQKRALLDRQQLLLTRTYLKIA